MFVVAHDYDQKVWQHCHASPRRLEATIFQALFGGSEKVHFDHAGLFGQAIFELGFAPIFTFHFSASFELKITSKCKKGTHTKPSRIW